MPASRSGPQGPPGLAGRGFAVGAGLDPGLAAELGAACEQLGYTSLWSNDHAAVGPPSGSALETLAALAAGAPTMTLGAGALALDRHSPAEIAAAVERSGLDPARLALAVGAGRSERPLEAVRAALPELRKLLPHTRLLLAALGPRMCELGGSAFDGVLVAWMTPPLIAAVRERIAAGAATAGRPAPPLAGYVRAAVGADAETRLARDEGFARGLGGGWAQHFGRLAEDPGRTGVFADYAAGIAIGLAPYEEELDVLIVRGLAAARLSMLQRIAAAAAPQAAVAPSAGSATSSSVSRETTAPNAK